MNVIVLIIIMALFALGIILLKHGAVKSSIFFMVISIFILVFDFSAVKSIFIHEKTTTSDQYIAKNGFLLDNNALSEEEFENRAKEENQKLARENSDIKGKTKLEKVQMGLGQENGSDTDGDGLTDK